MKGKIFLCAVICIAVIFARPVFANWMPTPGEMATMFGEALGEQIGESIGRTLWGDKVYDDFNKQFPYGTPPDSVMNPQTPTQRFNPSTPAPYVPPSKPWWQFW